MAYTDYDFYKNKYYGNVVPEADFLRTAERASDFLDQITFDRLIDGLPDNERAKEKVQKATCAVCDKIYQMELAEKQALSAADKGTSSEGSGTITSRSAGSESISYASPTEMANSAKTWSAVYQAVGNADETNKLLLDTAKSYLTGVKDNKGKYLLYAGVK